MYLSCHHFAMQSPRTLNSLHRVMCLSCHHFLTYSPRTLNSLHRVMCLNCHHFAMQSPRTLNSLHRAMYISCQHFAMQLPRTLKHVVRDSLLINVQLATAVRDRLQTQQPHFSHEGTSIFVSRWGHLSVYRFRMVLDSSDSAVQTVSCSVIPSS
jgi:hypothetical protein